MAVVESAESLLREARHGAGLTQAEVARRAGVTQSVVSAYESGRRQPSLPVLLALLRANGYVLDSSLEPVDPAARVPLSGPVGRRVRRHRRAVVAAAARYGVERVAVFGSVARGTDASEADVDLLVDLPEGIGLFALGRLRRELEELLGSPVDLVPADGLKADVRAAVEADLVPL